MNCHQFPNRSTTSNARFFCKKSLRCLLSDCPSTKSSRRIRANVAHGAGNQDKPQRRHVFVLQLPPRDADDGHLVVLLRCVLVRIDDPPVRDVSKTGRSLHTTGWESR